MIQLCRYFEPGQGARLGALLDGEVYDLTTTGQGEYASLVAWLESVTHVGVEEATRSLEATVSGLDGGYRWENLQAAPNERVGHVLPPVDRQEVWASGVTYLRSRDAREEESEGVGVYDKVYDAERPELFFKATPHRVVGPNDYVFIRSDATWNVPEPELTVLVAPDMQIVGYTIGNDVSSRDIEGENPLYLPQAKVYSRCAAVGPAVTLAPDFEAGGAARIGLTIRRDGEVVFEGETQTDQMKRSITELVGYLGRCNSFPHGVYLMTGTGLVPPDDYTLWAGDEVLMSIERVGQMANSVQVAP